MLVKAMEVSGIEGNFRSTCENVMQVLRTNKDSVMAMMEVWTCRYFASVCLDYTHLQWLHTSTTMFFGYCITCICMFVVVEKEIYPK